MSSIILEMDNITKKFSGVPVLHNVCFKAEKGEIISIVGENGAGKSTLMKILSGSYPSHSYEGSIKINGKKKEFYTPNQSEEAGIAMIYQEINMHLDLSVSENLFLGHWLKNGLVIDWAKMKFKTMEYMKLIGLDINPKITLRDLSTSQQQLVSIVRALAKQPKILVLDEPTSALTQTEVTNLFNILLDLKNKDVTCILISHKLDEVFSISDRITVLRDGQIVATHNKDSTTPEEIVNEMVGRKISSFYPKECVNIGKIVLEAIDYTVSHPLVPKKNIVDNVSFNLRQGEILGIAGLVGSGRSELVSAVFGRIRKKKGRLILNGKEITIDSPRDAIMEGIALVTEDRKADGFVGMLSIKDNITLASLKAISKLTVINKKMEKDKVNSFFRAINIKAKKGICQLVLTLSGGNQQKVVLSKWLMTKPGILILDEPTRGIDVGAKYEIYKIMIELVKKGTSIIMISSEMPELIHMSDRILVLSNGILKAEFKADECSHEKIMAYASGAAGLIL